MQIDTRGVDGEPPAIKLGVECIVTGFNLRSDDVDIELSGDSSIAHNVQCRTEGALISGDGCRFYANNLRGEDITITGDNNTVGLNVNVGSIDDQGSGNKTDGGNT